MVRCTTSKGLVNLNQEKIAILVDSGSDIPLSLHEKYNIYQIPLTISFPEGDYLDGETISAQEVYDRLDKDVPKTSLPSGARILKILEKIRTDGYEKLFVVCISSGLSGTFNVLRLLCEEYEELESFVLDSKNISIGSGMLAIQAAIFLEDGMGWEELKNIMPQKISRSKVFFCIKTLEYLKRGGRIGKVAAALGSAVSLKPIITCNEEGIYDIVAKCIGRKSSLKKMLELSSAYGKKAEHPWFAIMHGDAEEEALAIYHDFWLNFPDGALMVRGQISPALVVHTGPGLLGIGIYLG